MAATAGEKLAAVERELKMRRTVYGRKVADGTMNEGFAMGQIGIFEQIADDYRAQAEKERLL